MGGVLLAHGYDPMPRRSYRARSAFRDCVLDAARGSVVKVSSELALPFALAAVPTGRSCSSAEAR